MEVPFVDLRIQFRSLRHELMEAVQAVIDSASFILGEELAAFEREFAAFCRARDCVGVGSGGDALLLTLRALGIGAGDEVIVPANTFIGTAFAVTLSGAAPVLVDCRPDTCTIDPDFLSRAITARTRAIIPVHLYGHPADMDPILELARRRGLLVIEDACQAHGAQYKNRPCGSLGDAGCFSFYPGKNLGACGDGGAVVTSDPSLAGKIRAFRHYGQAVKNRHDELGWNSRLDNLQAAILQLKLQRLRAWNSARRDHARRYLQLLSDLPLGLPFESPDVCHVYHLFVIRHPKRDALLRFLAARGITCGIHYPLPVHLQQAYSSLGLGKGAYPVAEQLAQEVLSLPMYPELTGEQIDYVCGNIRSFLETHG